MGRQFAQGRIESTRGQESGTLESQCPPDIGITAHQIEIEVGLEDRLHRLVIHQRTFIAVEAGSTRRADNPIGHDQQR